MKKATLTKHILPKAPGQEEMKNWQDTAVQLQKLKYKLWRTEQQRQKTNLQTCASSEDLDQPTHSQSD